MYIEFFLEQGKRDADIIDEIKPNDNDHIIIKRNHIFFSFPEGKYNGFL